MLIVPGQERSARAAARSRSRSWPACASRASTVWYIMAKDEGHGFAKKANRDYTYGAIALFLRDNLLK